MLDKRKIITIFGAVLFVATMAFGLFKFQKTIDSQKQLISKLSESNQELNQVNKEVRGKYTKLVTQNAERKGEENETLQPADPIESEEPGYEEFEKIVNTTYQELYNYTPETYEQRKDKVKNYLSDDLMKTYFGNKGTFGDAANNESKLTKASVYHDEMKDNQIQGIVVARYESRYVSEYASGEFFKGMELYEITYDSAEKKLTHIQSLGSGFTGDMLN
ncbi:hypothetical protein [Enterococcus pallens]|uniref:Uncharacterized protein n=1 Tax=Enterococcus pallens ATCC BAA-351 TaxID=1158607 RepID=R2S0D9_9ENTE|nr:hypothetical protein [Enterococcus pallens]EOH86281.1 hypothetical protein UAU_05302 [Enterococcus pallens ATCC BAA-351]EOU09395.1 hypothetical protein I588_05241 [Enterococcus pallens ATCC BAA-351]OJG76435.1 hypothetical protein RV10_GL003763 [Enterococcus pallens]